MATTEPNFEKIHRRGTRENKHLFSKADVTKIRKTESKSKLELFYRLFIELFGHIFRPRLKYI